MEYTGQLAGGPDEGNLISATTREVRYEVTYRSWPDGQGLPVSHTVWGFYVWDEGRGVFAWHLGPLPAPEPNKPTGSVVLRPWKSIPAGWFVKAPNGTWYEVLANIRDNDQQEITLAVGEARPRFWYAGDVKVPCRRGTHDTEVSDAVDVLGEGAQILEDRK